MFFNAYLGNLLKKLIQTEELGGINRMCAGFKAG